MALLIDSFLADFRETFYTALEQKTGWEKEQIKLTFEQCLVQAIAHYLEVLNSAKEKNHEGISRPKDYARCSHR